jgi:integrase
MSCAVDKGFVERNPVHGVRRYRGEPRQRYLSQNELAWLGAVLDRASGLGIHPFAAKIIELLCLTGCRIGEVAALRWSEVDLQDGCLQLSDTKTGQSMRQLGAWLFGG